MKSWFKVEGDYLSAFATLVAAYVAWGLFSDWRHPEKYNETKERTFKILGVTAQIRFRAQQINETAIELKNSKNCIVLNKDYLDGNKTSLKETIFDVIPHVRSLNNNEILDQFTKLERHSAYLEIFHKMYQREYLKYYDHLTSTLNVDVNTISPIFYDSYTKANICPDANVIDDLIKSLERQVGYRVAGDNSQIVKFNNINHMSEEAIKLVDELDELIISNLEKLMK